LDRLKSQTENDTVRYLVALGRLLYSLIFVVAGFGHFSHQEIAYAAAQGVPLASVVVPVSGAMAIVGGFSILLGFHGKLGAWLLVLFLVPVTFAMHNFWAVKDPMMQQIRDGHVPEEFLHAGCSAVFHANRNGPAKPRCEARSGSLS
jgi:putative oxidoreductase